MAYFLLFFFCLIQSAYATTEFEVFNFFQEAKAQKATYHARNISPAVYVVEQLVEKLKAETVVQKAGQRIAALRKLIGEGAGVGGLRSRKTHGERYKLKDAEKEIISNAITYIETAAALLNAHFSFHFCQREQTQPYGRKVTIPGAYRKEDAKTLNAMATDGRLSFEEQKHLTIVYVLTRTTQLRIENNDMPLSQIPIYIRRTINNRHLPDFMRTIYKQALAPNQSMSEMLKCLPGPWNLLDFNNPHFALIATRKKDKSNDNRHTITAKQYALHQMTRHNEFLDVIEEHQETVNKEDEMQLYAVPTDHHCYWYATVAIYGYERPWDIFDLAIDNLRDEDEFRLKLSEVIRNGAASCDPDDLMAEWLNPNQDFSNADYLEKVLKHLRELTCKNVSKARNFNTLVNYFSFLSPKRTIITHQKNKPFLGVTSVEIPQIKHILRDPSLLFRFRHHYTTNAHVSILVPKATTPQTLVDWVKAIEREKATQTPLTPAYVNAWT